MDDLKQSIEIVLKKLDKVEARLISVEHEMEKVYEVEEMLEKLEPRVGVSSHPNRG